MDLIIVSEEQCKYEWSDAIGLEFDGGQVLSLNNSYLLYRKGTQVKIAEHALTGHKVAIKILNRRQIKKMEMEEKVD
ncbi:hypothetical protein HPP92_009026 [Vanilla planifolia]|uniref:Protein kinase domain-containing protein n=1 Tax=Vanilla planifolia TaxID=51239 RepID=A0A835RFF3_VANPL|nr:hypothetical protein HPP92_009026 [Vanilla planifolia]